MIAKEFRFHGHGSLNYVYKQGRSVRKPLCTLRYAPNPRYDHYRLAVVVSKKVSKSAVVRNRIRRRVYAAAQGIVAPDSRYDLVFVVYGAQLAVIPDKELNKIIYGILQISGVGKSRGGTPLPVAEVKK